MMLCETATSWARRRLEVTLPKRRSEEKDATYVRRLRRCCVHINVECDVEGLCKTFPKRVQKLLAKPRGCLEERPREQQPVCTTLRVVGVHMN
eukprot:3744120-Lingulodinium_polyedra.AAC.1